VVGDRVEILQLETNGTPVRTPATITTIEVGSYPIDENAFLVFKLSAPLQPRENSFTVPVFKEDRLVGLVMRYDQRTQTADVVPAPVIQHFLAAVGQQMDPRRFRLRIDHQRPWRRARPGAEADFPTRSLFTPTHARAFQDLRVGR